MTTPTWTPHRRPLGLCAVDVLLRAKERVGLYPPPLSATRVRQAARRATGLEEPDAGDVEVPLHLLAHGFEHEADVTPLGHELATRMLGRAMARRLLIQEAHRRDPALAGIAIERPVFVVGLPRTGTSLLFNLIAQDKAARPLLGWEAFDPLPPARAHPGRPDPRRRRWRRFVRGVTRAAPGYQAVHPLTVDGPEECVALLLRSFVTWTWSLFASLPSYAAWLWSRPMDELAPTYHFHEMQLQILQQQRAGGYWLLKSPAHLNALPALLRVYPDARVICTHRSLSQVLPSACSLFAVSRSIYSDRVNPLDLGREALDTIERTVARAVAVRDVLPSDRILDVRFDDLVGDPQGTVARVFAHLGRTPSPETEAGIARHLEQTSGKARPAHHYSLEQFGLKPDAVQGVGAAYHRRFDLV